MSSKRADKGGKIQVFPDAEKLNEIKSALPQFEPVDVTKLLKLPPAEAKKEISRLTSSGTAAQLHQLLDGLGVDRLAADAWKRGFHLLAMVHHGAGHFTHKQPRRANRNASRVTPEHDRLLYKYVIDRQAEGKTRNEALRLLSKDDHMCRQLGLSPNSRSEKSDKALRVEALRKRMIRLDKGAPPGSLLAAVTGDYPIYGSGKDQATWFRTFESPPLPSSGKSKPSK